MPFIGRGRRDYTIDPACYLANQPGRLVMRVENRQESLIWIPHRDPLIWTIFKWMLYASSGFIFTAVIFVTASIMAGIKSRTALFATTGRWNPTGTLTRLSAGTDSRLKPATPALTFIITDG